MRSRRLLTIGLLSLCAMLLAAHAPLPAGSGDSQIFLPSLSLDRPEETLLFANLDEPPGSSVFSDSSPYGRSGSCTGESCPSTGIAGLFGLGAHFDGLNDSIQFSDAPELDTAIGQDLSVEAWIFLQSANCGNCRILNKWDGSRGFSFDAADGAGNSRLSFLIRDGTHTSLTRASIELSLTEWHYVAAVFDRASGIVRLFVDGVETKYLNQQSTLDIGDLSNSVPVVAGQAPGEERAFRGLIGGFGMYKAALGSARILSNALQRPVASPNYTHWNSAQAPIILEGFSQADPANYAALNVGESWPMTRSDYGGAPLRAQDGIRFRLPDLCEGCEGRAMSFATPGDLDSVRRYYASLTPASWQITQDNLLLQLDSRISEAQVDQFRDALDQGLLEEMLKTTTVANPAQFYDWEDFYPMDRGQQRDPATGRSQRTLNRWNPDNRWYFGQTLWLYQDPDGGDAPPFGLPGAYQGKDLEYTFQYQCEKRVDRNASKDCLEWEWYIELGSSSSDPKELFNWERGGFQWITHSEPNWEVYYLPSVFGESCSKEAILSNFTDANLQDPGNKLPLYFRLPAVVGMWSNSPRVCTVAFNSYLQRADDIILAELWRLNHRLISQRIDPVSGEPEIQENNRYYKYLTKIVEDVVYKKFGDETFWLRRLEAGKPPLSNGLIGFYWWTWLESLGTSEYDWDDDPTWSPLQWCRVDENQGPQGLGKLICEE